MSEQHDGGPAFGGSRYERVNIDDDSTAELPVSYPGMSLRDWFAGQALMSLGTWTPIPQIENLWCAAAMNARADFAYRQADAMLKARAGGSL